MSIDERSRHELYLRLEQLLGPAEASTLMEHLPPVGWADVATKRDLDQMAENLRLGITGDLRLEFNSQLREFSSQIRSVYAVMVATMLGTATLAGTLAFVAARVV